MISPKFISTLIHRKSFRIAIEGTGLRGNPLIKMILLMTIAYSSAIFQGTEMSEKAGAKICISPKIAEKKVPKTQYIWQGSGWKKVGKLS